MPRFDRDFHALPRKQRAKGATGYGKALANDGLKSLQS